MKCEICHEADAAAVIHVKKDGDWSWEKVHMDYVAPKKK